MMKGSRFQNSLTFCHCVWIIITLHYLTSTVTVAKNTTPLHPMLYFDSSEVEKLRHRAQTTHTKIASILIEAGTSLKENTAYYMPPVSFEKFGSRWNELYGNNLCAFAMYCLLFPDDDEAFNLVQLYMDRMTSYPDWYVTASRKVDEVPIGHSLTGYATAVDFLYRRFDLTRRKKYLSKLKTETQAMYAIIIKKRSGWTRQHIHNHAPTNVLSVLLGGMVYGTHYPDIAKPWIEISIELFEKAMKLFAIVIDGSCDEGVAYGSYTTRGITQYVFLALKHFDIDHTKNPWLKEHFWFMFATTMPGYQRTVGIADSNHNWFYGPESQLVFLDAYVLKNGYGNWLADKIRHVRPKNQPLARAMSQKWSTTHTEFIFYDPQYEAVNPSEENLFQVFHDWGVVTYGGGQYLKSGNTFLSFKSGAVHGEGIADVVEHNLFSRIVNGWNNFNAGHEHPDQNSFVFAPNGRYFITEALYSPKHSYLNNIVSFAPSKDSQCNQPFEGQIGECSKWLGYKTIPVSRGKIVTATQSDYMVHIAGEAVGAYRPELGLESVQRSMVLLNPEVLVVIDSIYLQQGSKLNRASSFFHNVLHNFHPYRHLGFRGAQVIYPEGPYAFFWFKPDLSSPAGTLHNQGYDSEYKERTTNFVNVTYDLEKDGPTRMVYMFVGPSTKIQSVYVSNLTDEHAIHMTLVVDGTEYNMSAMSLSAPMHKRMKTLGFGGYLNMSVRGQHHFFGMEKNPDIGNRCHAVDAETVTDFVRSVMTSRKPVTSSPNDLVTVDKTTAAETKTDFSRLLVLNVATFFVLFCFLFWVQRRLLFQPRKRCLIRSILFGGCLLWMFTLFNLDCMSCNEIVHEKNEIFCDIDRPIEITTFNRLPTIFITSLPGSGADLMEMIFQNSSDFLYMSTYDVNIPCDLDVSRYDPCYWPKNNIDHHATTAGWFSSIHSEPLAFLNNIKENSTHVQKMKRQFRAHNKSIRFAVNLESGFWNSKLQWLQRVVGHSSSIIIVVRDPRDWIYSFIRDDLTKRQLLWQKNVLNNYVGRDTLTCPEPSWLPWEYRKDHIAGSVIEELAQIWAENTATMIRNARSFQIVRFEDLIKNPKYAAEAILKRMGVTISIPQINRITRAVRSGYHYLRYEGPINDQYHLQWKNKLTLKNKDTIERICGSVMQSLGYI